MDGSTSALTYSVPPVPPHPAANGERPDTAPEAIGGAGGPGAAPPPPPPPEHAQSNSTANARTRMRGCYGERGNGMLRNLRERKLSARDQSKKGRIHEAHRSCQEHH